MNQSAISLPPTPVFAPGPRLSKDLATKRSAVVPPVLVGDTNGNRLLPQMRAQRQAFLIRLTREAAGGHSHGIPKRHLSTRGTLHYRLVEARRAVGLLLSASMVLVRLGLLRQRISTLMTTSRLTRSHSQRREDLDGLRHKEKRTCYSNPDTVTQEKPCLVF